MPDRLRPLLDRDTGLLATIGAVGITAHMAEINAVLQFVGIVFGLIIMWPKVVRAVKNKPDPKD
jgi:hypothetical protein